MGRRRTARRSAAKEEKSVVAMDETIWKELPEELLDIVISKVPIATILRFRSVYRKWNSSAFLQRWVPPELPLIYALVEAESEDSPGIVEFGALYDPLVKKWYFSTHIPQLRWEFHEPAPGRGLLCYPDHRNASFRVGNLLTRNWKVYPWSDTTRSSLFHPSVDYSFAFVDNLLKIVWVKPGGKYGVDDFSAEKSATTEGSIPDNFVRHSSLQERGLDIGSVAYFLGKKPDVIMSYDVVRGAWEQLLILKPPNSHRVSLVDGGGRLWLVGWVNNNAYAKGISVCVWELDKRMRSWIEVARTPTWYCSKFSCTWADVACLSTSRLLVISLSGCELKQHTTESLRLNEVFTYDVVSRKWSRLSDCIPPGSTKPQWVCEGIGFFPSLSTSP